MTHSVLISSTLPYFSAGCLFFSQMNEMPIGKLACSLLQPADAKPISAPDSGVKAGKAEPLGDALTLLSGVLDRRLDDNHRRYLAARVSTVRCYNAEKRDYAGKWAEGAEARREGWRQLREMWESLERDRRRSERQQANLQRLHEQQRENLRHLKEREKSVANRHRRRMRSRSRDDAMER